MLVRTFYLINCVGFVFFFFFLHRMSRIGLWLSSIFIMSVHYFLPAFRSMLGTCHNQILFIWRLSGMPRHLNACKRNTAALSDYAVALLLPAVPHNPGLPADLWWAETLSYSAASPLTSPSPSGCIVVSFFTDHSKPRGLYLVKSFEIGWEEGEKPARKVPSMILCCNLCAEGSWELVGALSSPVALKMWVGVKAWEKTF